MTIIKKSFFCLVTLYGSFAEVSHHYHQPEPASIVQQGLPEEGDNDPDPVWKHCPDYVSGLR